MRRRKVIIVLTVCVLVAIGVVAFWPGEPEPEYNGIKLSEWVDRAGNVWTSRETEAIRHIGTNAQPFLIKWIKYEQPSWRKEAWTIYSKLPRRMRRRSVDAWIFGVNADVRKSGAAAGFQILGASASNALPDLYFLALNPRTSQTAFECLEGIGYSAVPTLNILANVPDEAVKTKALDALQNIGPRDFWQKFADPHMRYESGDFSPTFAAPQTNAVKEL